MSNDIAAREREIRAAVNRFRERANASGGVRVRFNDGDAANTRGMDRVFVGLGATLDQMPDALRDAVPTIREAFRDNFVRQGGRVAWAPLAPATREERARLGFPPARPILKRTGALERHVMTTPAVVRTRGDSVELRISPGNVVAGVPKYRALALGSPRTNLPGRPMVVITSQSATRVTSAISRSLRQRAARNGVL